jgi:glycosyltransferase 2 family protein
MNGGTSPVQDRASRPARRAPLWLRFLLVAALVAAAILLFDLRAVGAAMVSLSPAVILLALLLATLDRFLMGFKWKQLIHAGGERIRLRDAVGAYYQAAFTGRLIPAAAAHDVLRAYVVHRCGVSPGLLVGSITLEKVIGMLASVTAAGLGLLFLLLAGGIDPGIRILLMAAVGGGVVVSLTALVVAFSTRFHDRAVRVLERWAPNRLRGLATKASAAALSYRHRGPALLANFGLSLAETGLQVVKLVVIAIGLGVAMPLVPLLAVISLGIYARRVFAYIESWGLAEASGVATFVLLGIAPELAFALAIANYAVTTIAILPGGYLLYRTGVGGGRPGHGAGESAAGDPAAPRARSESLSSV